MADGDVFAPPPDTILYDGIDYICGRGFKIGAPEQDGRPLIFLTVKGRINNAESNHREVTVALSPSDAKQVMEALRVSLNSIPEELR